MAAPQWKGKTEHGFRFNSEGIAARGILPEGLGHEED
jgi:hypothetical protein